MTDIKEVSLEELTSFLTLHGEQKFRAKQVYEWIWKKGAHSFEEMNNLSKTTRSLLESSYQLYVPQVVEEKTSSDDTVKVVLLLYDEKMVEGVLIPSKDRVTACISSQVGCALGCAFCATGTLGLSRNLTSGEIFDQVFVLNELSLRHFGQKLNNIVIMGMGEPLMNYDNVLKAIDYLTTEKGLGMSPQRITLSTAGVSTKIKQLADDGFRCNLAISLHSANSKTRDQLMKINSSNPLEELSDAISYFSRKTGERVTLEYLLLDGVNDSIEDAAKLALFCRAFPCKINVIEYNPTAHSPFKKSEVQNVRRFVEFLESKNMIVNVRASKGKDIDAACGQLLKNNNKRQ